MSPAPKPALDMSVNVAGITFKNPILAASRKLRLRRRV